MWLRRQQSAGAAAPFCISGKCSRLWCNNPQQVDSICALPGSRAGAASLITPTTNSARRDTHADQVSRSAREKSWRNSSTNCRPTDRQTLGSLAIIVAASEPFDDHDHDNRRKLRNRQPESVGPRSTNNPLPPSPPPPPLLSTGTKLLLFLSLLLLLSFWTRARAQPTRTERKGIIYTKLF